MIPAVKKIPALSFIVAAMAVTMTLVGALVLSQFKIAEISGASIGVLILICASMAGNITSMFYSGFTHVTRHRDGTLITDDRTLLGAVGTLQGVLVLTAMIQKMPDWQIFSALSAFQVVGVYLYLRLMNGVFNTAAQTLRYSAILSAASMCAYSLCSYAIHNLKAYQVLAFYGTAWQGVTIICGLTLTLVWSSFSRDIAPSWQNLMSGMRARLMGQNHGWQRRHLWWVGLGAGCSIITVWLVTLAVHAGQHLDVPLWAIAGYSPLFVPALYISWTELQHRARQHAELTLSSRLAGPSALRLLHRHISDQNFWATSIGIRTSAFTIDHDPDMTMTTSLPSTLLQIRSEEIFRCVNEVLNGKILHNQPTAQKVYGAIDPELAVRPCVDILKLFSCLYLDAGPLIERRINGLMTLLPIVNPGLAKILHPEQLSTLFKKNQWFFHFDYHWVDQQIINTVGTTRYGVHMDPLSWELRQAMVEHLRRAKGMGNFLWLGRDAQERLIQEAPMLAPIIEPMTLKLSSGEDQLIFVIKFESLVPRLQRYFDLDYTRRVLLDFEPSAESAKLINIFKLQCSQARTPEAMINLVEAIAAYPWRGFKEKDQAIKVVVQAYQYAKEQTEAAIKRGETPGRSINKLNEAINESVETIGYPSQILHRAHMTKVALRDMVQLTKSAAIPGESRFEESWVLLASLDYRRYSRKERELVAKLIMTISTQNSVLEHKSVQPKLIDAATMLYRADLHLKDPTCDVHELFSAITKGLCKHRPTAETLTLIFDALAFAAQLSGKEVQLNESAQKAFEEAVKFYETANAAYATALWSRWLELRNKQKPQNAA